MKYTINNISKYIGAALFICTFLFAIYTFFFSYGKLWAKVINLETEMEQIKKYYEITVPNKYTLQHLKTIDMQLKGKVKDCTLYPTRNGAKCVDERTGKVYTIYF